MKKNFLDIIFFSNILLTSMIISVCSAQTDIMFEFSNIEPSISSLPNIQFVNTTGQSENNLYSLPGGLLQQRVNNDNFGCAYYLWHKGNQEKTIHPDLDLLIQARLKIHDVSGFSNIIIASDGIYRYSIVIGNDETNGYFFDIETSSFDHISRISNISNYFTLSIRSQRNSNTFEVLLDNALIFSGKAPNCYPEEDVNGLIWGDYNDKQFNGADIDWDYIRLYQGAKIYSQYDVDRIVSNVLMWGDLNNDGKIGIYEAIRALQITVSPASKE
ncbi:secreted protein [Candidatus Magnetomorum sp. HK-1]|nr:secreted protein [Candidatus Magnetomorum sp. HK-1]